MTKDIFIDNCIAKNFANPLDPEYKGIIKWLLGFDKDNPRANAYLVVSNKLIEEYYRTCGNAYSQTNIVVIIDVLTRQGRLEKINNDQIKEFKKKHFTKRVMRSLRCNIEDRDHIPVVLSSYRKYALSLDNKFIYDLMNFPGFKAMAARRPQDLPYDH